MTHSQTYYCNLNRILLLTVGLWPYQQSKFTRFQCIFFSAILSASIIFQLTPLITFKRTLDFVIKVMSSVSFFTLFIIQYNSFCLNIEAVKNFLTQFEHVHNKLKDKNEIAIVYKYGCIAKRYTIWLTVTGICGLFTVITAQSWSNMAEMNVSINTSQLHHLFFITEYFIDQEKHFYLILLHMYAAFCAGATIMVGIGTMFITCIKHICGMFRIASYRIENAVNTNTLKNITTKNKILMTKGIICAVDIHCQAMKLSKYFVSTFEIMIVCFTACVISCFSFNLFQIFQASAENNINKFFLPFTYAVASLLYMFLANYVGQNIIDHNNHIFLTTYNVQWYRTPLNVQRMILFLLQRGAKQFSLSVGGIFDACIEGFALILKLSISYFTVMHSTR